MKSCNSLSEWAATMMHHAVVNRGHGPGPNSSERSDGPAGPGRSGCEVSGSEAAGRMERGGPAPGPARPGDGVRRAADGARRVALLPQAGRQRGGQKLRRGGPGGGKGLRRRQRRRRRGGGAERGCGEEGTDRGCSAEGADRGCTPLQRGGDGQAEGLRCRGERTEAAARGR